MRDLYHRHDRLAYWVQRVNAELEDPDKTQTNYCLSYLDTKKVGDIVNLKVLRDNRVEDIAAVTLGPSQNSVSDPSLSPDSDIPRPSLEPPGSSNDLMDEFYDNCVNMAGEELCNRLFGGGR